MAKISYQTELSQLIEVGTYIYKQLGHGCKDNVYSEVLELELELRNIPFKRKRISLSENKNQCFICYDKIVVDLDTHSFLSEEQENSFMRSLRHVENSVGLLFNFGNKNLQYIKVGDEHILQ